MVSNSLILMQFGKMSAVRGNHPFPGREVFRQTSGREDQVQWGRSSLASPYKYHPAPVITLTLTKNSGNKYRIIVMVSGERTLELTLTVVRNYISVPQLQRANLPRRGPRLQACDYTIENGDRAVPKLCYHRTDHHDLTLKLFNRPAPPAMW